MFFASSAPRNLICFSTSQLAVLRVPPYRPGAAPDTPWAAGADSDRPDSDRPGSDGVFGGGLLSRAVDSVNGSRPVLSAAWRNTSPPPPPDGPSPEPEPPERVSTTPRTTAATTPSVSRATRGALRHQGVPPPLPGSAGGAPPGPEPSPPPPWPPPSPPPFPPPSPVPPSVVPPSPVPGRVPSCSGGGAGAPPVVPWAPSSGWPYGGPDGWSRAGPWGRRASRAGRGRRAGPKGVPRAGRTVGPRGPRRGRAGGAVGRRRFGAHGHSAPGLVRPPGPAADVRATAELPRPLPAATSPLCAASRARPQAGAVGGVRGAHGPGTA